MSAMPVDITHAIDTHRPPEWGFVTEVEMSYEISTDTVASIDEPDIDRSVMRPDDALYYFRRLFCGEGPCAPSVISQSRQDAADTFCMENVGQRVSVTFHDNGARESAGGCAGDPPPPGMPTMPPPPRPTS
jgi:hypothetical protein